MRRAERARHALRLFAFLFLCGSFAAPAAVPPPVAQALAAAGIPDTAASLYVHEVGAERPLLSHGADRSFNPASTMKLVTTYAALELLGPAYTWPTEVYVTGPLSNGVLAGDLILKGHGDPKLTVERLWLLLRNLRARGLREVRGDVILDRTFFTADDHDPARFDGEPSRPYNTGPDALLVNFKAVTVHFVPEPENRTVRLIAEPALAAASIANAVSLAEGPCGDWVSRLKFEVSGGPEAARLTISGSYARECGERSRSFSLLGHRAYAAALLSDLWQSLGGSVGGTVRDGPLPQNARLLTITRSPPLADVIRDINKFSNNVMARQLFLTLGAAGMAPPGTAEKARVVIKQTLAQRGLTIPELVIENGSGLSRLERISARSLGALLMQAFRSPVMPEFMSSLPVVASDGTMRKRMPNGEVAGQAHIKGGTLVDVRAIAGYVLDARGRRLVVVFIVNHPSAAASLPAQDALLTWIHRGARSAQ